MSSHLVAGRLGRLEFIAMIAALIAINAFAIDIMLPGLQQIGAGLGEPDPNRRQLVIPAYLFGFGVLQVVFGPLSDRFGRRGPLLFGLGIYCLAAVSAFLVSDFNSLVLLRFVQGAGAAASAVIATALVRDLFVGDAMARTMSLVFMVLMISPILAPALGQALLQVMQWRGLFLFMALLGICVTVWVTLRLPETLKPENRRPLSLRSVIEGFGIVFSNRIATGYILAVAMIFGALMGYLNSSQQVYVEHYGVGTWFPAYFAAGAGASALGGFANSRLVGHLGMRRLGDGALAAFMFTALLMAGLGLAGALPLPVFVALSMVIFFAFSMVMPNYGALALEPLGAVAGTAASTQGFLQMVLGAAIGTAIGQFFDGTAVPMAIGFLALGVIARLFVFIAGRSRGADAAGLPASPPLH